MHPLFEGAAALVLLLAAVALFFFVFTKGALVLRRWRGLPVQPDSHIYPVYSQPWLIRLVDQQPVISAILLFQYPRLVDVIADELRRTDLRGRDVLITSCAFGNVIPRVADAAFAAGARKLVMVDLIEQELTHARAKLPQYADRIACHRGDATAMPLPAASAAANVLFFLLHELTPEMKVRAIDEAARMLEPGGKLFLAEFHKPSVWPLRVLSWLYFKTFEPFGLALWDVQDPMLQLASIGGLQVQRHTRLAGNYQVLVATRR
jgi:SAM-dependent methyltransferase